MKKKHSSIQLLSVLFAIVLSLSMMLVLAGCGGGTAPENEGTDSSATANMPNPVVEVDSPEAVNDQLGVNMFVPKDAVVSSCSVIDDSLGQIIFTLSGKDFTYRAQNTSAIEDISGLHYDFTSKGEFDTAGVACSMQYNEGEAGFCHWYDDIAKTTYSISVDAGASEEVLTEAATALIAEQRLM